MFDKQAKVHAEHEMNESGEDYIKVIYALKRKLDLVRPVDVAHAMGFSRPSVSVAISKLREKGFITLDGKTGVHLTERGAEIARRIYENHAILTKFLMKTAGTDEETAEKEACRMEHFISLETLEGIKRFVEGLSVCAEEQI